jgi:hypothetical protein
MHFQNQNLLHYDRFFEEARTTLALLAPFHLLNEHKTLFMEKNKPLLQQSRSSVQAVPSPEQLLCLQRQTSLFPALVQ